MSSQKTGPTKSERTRGSILAAARDLFAQRGYDGASVREIAGRAGVDAALVIRYFGSKEGLFAEATEFDLRLPDAGAVARHQVGRVLARHFLDVWEGPENRGSLTILLRTAASSDAAAAKIRAIFARQVMPILERIASPEEVAARAGLVATQILGLALCRYVLALPPVVAMTGDEIVAAIAPTLQRYAIGRLG